MCISCRLGLAQTGHATPEGKPQNAQQAEACDHENLADLAGSQFGGACTPKLAMDERRARNQIKRRPALLAPALLVRGRPLRLRPLAPALAPSIFAHGSPPRSLSPSCSGLGPACCAVAGTPYRGLHAPRLLRPLPALFGRRKRDTGEVFKAGAPRKHFPTARNKSPAAALTLEVGRPAFWNPACDISGFFGAAHHHHLVGSGLKLWGGIDVAWLLLRTLTIRSNDAATLNVPEPLKLTNISLSCDSVDKSGRTVVFLAQDPLFNGAPTSGSESIQSVPIVSLTEQLQDEHKLVDIVLAPGWTYTFRTEGSGTSVTNSVRADATAGVFTQNSASSSGALKRKALDSFETRTEDKKLKTEYLVKDKKRGPSSNQQAIHGSVVIVDLRATSVSDKTTTLFKETKVLLTLDGATDPRGCNRWKAGITGMRVKGRRLIKVPTEFATGIEKIIGQDFIVDVTLVGIVDDHAFKI
ncbi:hypothetical protein C8R47DRAFT_1083722 [Mycena vitilis]|nr:hypothetical protein C8R47DRAFT_1083722 [Mycena vitilis]